MQKEDQANNEDRRESYLRLVCAHSLLSRPTRSYPRDKEGNKEIIEQETEVDRVKVFLVVACYGH
jgi:hypothetical protein